MDRRRFVFATGGIFTSGVFNWRLSSAQSLVRQYKIGYLASSPPTVNKRSLEAFRDGLRVLGYVVGGNLAIEYRWTEDDVASLPKRAAELASLKVELIFAWTTPAVIAARKAVPASMPIVMVGIADPVGSGLVASLARPGGNITGVSNISADLSSKLVELLVEVVPGFKRLAGVRNALNPSSRLALNETAAAATKFNIEFQNFDIRTADDLEVLFESMSKARVSGAVFFADPMWISQRKLIADLAIRHRLPTAFARAENVESGGLMAYGPNLSDQFRRCAYYVDKILKGANPADLPVEQPSTLELAINVKAAKALGLTIPPTVLLRADRVIE